MGEHSAQWLAGRSLQPAEEERHGLWLPRAAQSQLHPACAVQPDDQRPRTGATLKGRPSRCLVLRNMVGPGEVDEDLEEEVGGLGGGWIGCGSVWGEGGGRRGTAVRLAACLLLQLRCRPPEPKLSAGSDVCDIGATGAVTSPFPSLHAAASLSPQIGVELTKYGQVCRAAEWTPAAAHLPPRASLVTRGTG